MSEGCPHCKSKVGIYSTFTEVRSALFDWKGVLIESDHSTKSIFNRKTGVCAACNKRVHIPTKEDG